MILGTHYLNIVLEAVFTFFEQGQGYFKLSKYIAIIVAVFVVMGIFQNLLIQCSIPRLYTWTCFSFVFFLS